MNAVDIFLDIVQINSETGNGQEKEMSEYIQHFLTERNIAFSVDAHHQIFATIAGNQNTTIMFCAHMDTVAPGKNIIPILHEDGKITSSGNTILGADNKASLACMLWLIDEISQGKIKNHHSLEFLFTAEEEGDFPKIYEWNAEQSSAEAVFIFDKANEPNINNVVTRAGYLTCFEIQFTGKGAHSSKPELATSALLMFQKFLENIRLGKQEDGESTFNIGTITAGEAPNTVPSSLFCMGDFRAFSAEKMEMFERQLQQAKEKVLSEISYNNAKIDIVLTPYCKGYQHNTASESFKRLEKAYQTIGFEKLEFVETQSGSDASFFMHLKNPIPAYCLGDGCFHIHTVKEYVTKENLQKLSEIMQNIAVHF